MAPTVFFNIGWMNLYRGLKGDSIQSGAGWVRKTKTGHEVYNFAPHRGRCYGYVRPPGSGWTINIDRLGANPGDNYVDGVLVVWVARDPRAGGGLVVVGWYKNARVYREHQDPPATATRAVQRLTDQASFLATAAQDDCIRLDPDDRTFRVPRNKPGAMGQSNVWFADSALGKRTIKRLGSYLAGLSRGGAPKRPKRRKTRRSGSLGAPRSSDPVQRARVEGAAIAAVWKHYESRGFTMRDVKKHNVGWDLEATRGRQKFLIEVKGLSGGQPRAELTPNEFAKMKGQKSRYRLCLVTNALSEKQRTISHVGFHADGRWRDQNGRALGIEEVRAARVSL